MVQYIDKSAVLAEIKELKEHYSKCPTRNNYEEGLKDGRCLGYIDAIDKINSLEVKEVDLDFSHSKGYKEQVGRVKAEIERLYNENKERHSIEGISASIQLRKVLSFIDSMEEEPKRKFKVGDTIVDPIDPIFTFHINKIENGKYIERDDEWVSIKEADANYKLVEEPVSEKLEEAANAYISNENNYSHSRTDTFKAGAEWQKQKMMKDAVEGIVEEPNPLQWQIISEDLEGAFVVKHHLTDGDTVKLIIIKED